MNNIEASFQRWLASDRVSPEDKKILSSMDERQKNDAFFQNASFGTGGMRGVLGPGTNRINIQNLGRVTVGFGSYLLATQKDAAKRGVVISHDNRFMSREFTLEFASILSKMGFKVYIFDALRPTPELSYAVRYYKAIAGIMVTASHNPANCNGYKIYDETGCQMVPSQVDEMLKYLDPLPDELSFEVPEASVKGEIITCGKDIDDSYCAMVESIQINPDLDKKDFKVVYSPQHGASYESAMRVFSECGYNIIPVAPQCIHDPAFGATKSPNPEVASAWELPLEYARNNHADLVTMTDPDGDRCGLAYLGKDGEYHRLTGNQSGALLIDYILSSKKKQGKLPTNGVIYDTIVTSSLGSIVAKSYGVATESFLTGFKFIGNRIAHYEKLGKGPKFLFGYEESYGCLVSEEVRDKDGVQAILLYTEMALYYKSLGLDLGQAWENLEKRFGFHYSTLKDIYFEGMEGSAAMKKMMDGLHASPLQEIAGVKVIKTGDYKNQVETTCDGKKTPIVGLPVSDVMKYYMEDGSTVCVRPSGTEPKVKFYIEVVSNSDEGMSEKGEKIYQAMKRIAGVS